MPSEGTDRRFTLEQLGPIVREELTGYVGNPVAQWARIEAALLAAKPEAKMCEAVCWCSSYPPCSPGACPNVPLNPAPDASPPACMEFCNHGIDANCRRCVTADKEQAARERTECVCPFPRIDCPNCNHHDCQVCGRAKAVPRDAGQPGVPDGDSLKTAAQRLTDAAVDYYNVYQRSGMRGAVIWVEDTLGRLVVLTRGEYRETIMANIHKLEGAQPRPFDVPAEPIRPADIADKMNSFDCRSCDEHHGAEEQCTGWRDGKAEPSRPVFTVPEGTFRVVGTSKGVDWRTLPPGAWVRFGNDVRRMAERNHPLPGEWKIGAYELLERVPGVEPSRPVTGCDVCGVPARDGQVTCSSCLECPDGPVEPAIAPPAPGKLDAPGKRAWPSPPASHRPGKPDDNNAVNAVGPCYAPLGCGTTSECNQAKACAWKTVEDNAGKPDEAPLSLVDDLKRRLVKATQDLVSNYDEMSGRTTDLEAKLAEAEGANRDLLVELGRAKKERTEDYEGLKQGAARIEQLETQLATRDARIAELEASNADLVREKGDAETQVARANIDRDLAIKERAQAVRENADLVKRCRDAEEQASALRVQRNEAFEQRDRLRCSYDELRMTCYVSKEAAVLAERDRVDGIWRHYSMFRDDSGARAMDRDKDIASGAPAPTGKPKR